MQYRASTVNTGGCLLLSLCSVEPLSLFPSLSLLFLLLFQARWDKLDLMLESHALMIKEQVEVMKANANNRIELFNQVRGKDDIYIFIHIHILYIYIRLGVCVCQTLPKLVCEPCKYVAGWRSKFSPCICLDSFP